MAIQIYCFEMETLKWQMHIKQFRIKETEHQNDQ